MFVYTLSLQSDRHLIALFLILRNIGNNLPMRRLILIIETKFTYPGYTL